MARECSRHGAAAEPGAEKMTMTTRIIQRFRVITTNTIVYQAWEPGTLMGRHSTVTFFDGRCFGRIGSDPDGSIYDGIPVGAERSAAVKRAYDERYAVAYEAIIRAFPEAADGKRDMGEITVTSATMGNAQVEIRS
jgi:hypothetical protein